MKFFFKNDSSLDKLKTSLETCFLQHDSYIFCQIVCISENKIKEKILITLSNYTNFIKSFETTLNSKHIQKNSKLKTKDTETRETKTERRKSSFTKRIGRKY